MKTSCHLQTIASKSLLSQEENTKLFCLNTVYIFHIMSFALTHQTKANLAIDGKVSLPAKSPYPHHRNNNNNLRYGSLLDSSSISLQRTNGNKSVPGLLHFDAIESDFSRISILQPKLKVNQPDDIYEQEADRVAKQVIDVSPSYSVTPIINTREEGRLGRKCSICETKKEDNEGEKLNISRKPSNADSLETTDQFTDEINNIRSSSSSRLDPSTKEFMGDHFGYDFSHVRIHTDARAAELAQAINAKAFTVGQDVAFDLGQYAPQTPQGKKLLAHELTHVIQQSRRSADASSSQTANFKTGLPDLLVTKSRKVPRQASEPRAIQRQPKEDDDFFKFGRSIYKAFKKFGSALEENKDKVKTQAAITTSADTPPQESLERAHRMHLNWNREEENQRFRLDYLRKGKERGLTQLYEGAIAAAYPDPNTEYLDWGESNTTVVSPWPTTTDVRPPPGIAKLPYIERPVNTLQFLRTDLVGITGGLGMGGLITVQPSDPAIQTGPDPTAGYNFDTYIVNMAGGKPIPAQYQGGTQYRVLMGSPECPGCHLGQGLVVDLAGEHPLLIAGTMGLEALPILKQLAAAKGMKAKDVINEYRRLGIKNAANDNAIPNAANDNAILPTEPNTQQLAPTGTDLDATLKTNRQDRRLIEGGKGEASVTKAVKEPAAKRPGEIEPSLRNTTWIEPPITGNPRADKFESRMRGGRKKSPYVWTGETTEKGVPETVQFDDLRYSDNSFIDSKARTAGKNSIYDVTDEFSFGPERKRWRTDKVLKTVYRQERARQFAGANQVVWIVQDPKVAAGLKKLFQSKGFTTFTVESP
jgi:Domain of unknown function (DUF4157)